MIDVDALKSSITVPDVLDTIPWPCKRNRACCPIHGGDNPTAFSFSDSWYCCFACGAKGDVIDLVQELMNCDFAGAVQWLSDTFGVRCGTVRVSTSSRSSSRKVIAPIRPRPVDPRIYALQEELEFQLECRDIYEHRLKQLPREVRSGQIDLSTYYSRQQKLDHWLQYVDETIDVLDHKVNQLRRRKRN